MRLSDKIKTKIVKRVVKHTGTKNPKSIIKHFSADERREKLQQMKDED